MANDQRAGPARPLSLTPQLRSNIQQVFEDFDSQCSSYLVCRRFVESRFFSPEFEFHGLSVSFIDNHDLLVCSVSYSITLRGFSGWFGGKNSFQNFKGSFFDIWLCCCTTSCWRHCLPGIWRLAAPNFAFWCVSRMCSLDYESSEISMLRDALCGLNEIF